MYTLWLEIQAGKTASFLVEFDLVGLLAFAMESQEVAASFREINDALVSTIT